MKISKSLLEMAHQLASMPVNQHSPKGNYINKPVVEETMTAAQKAKREEIVMSMKKNADDMKKRYGEDWENVMYATATKKAMMSEEELLEYEKWTDEHGVTWNDEGDSDKGHTNWGRGQRRKTAAAKHYHTVPYKDKEHAKGEGMKWDKDKRAWYHTDAGKSATSKFKKLHEETGEQE